VTPDHGYVLGALTSAASDKSVSPSGAGYHYNHNAETFMEVGNALGWSMADMLEH
jgi:hypothetical protein